MRVRITLTNENGEIFEGEAELTPAKVRQRGRARQTARRPVRLGPLPDVGMPLRPFLKRYARGRSGAAKFTLLVAHLAGGKTDVSVDSKDVQAAWNRTTAFLGGYNRAHATRAKDTGWVDSPGHGTYLLRDSWVEAAEGESL